MEKKHYLTKIFISLYKDLYNLNSLKLRVIRMRIKDISNLTINKTNKQISLNLRSRQLKKIGLTPEYLLELKLPKNFKLIKLNKEVK